VSVCLSLSTPSSSLFLSFCLFLALIVTFAPS
jgi:hypothetical protein